MELGKAEEIAESLRIKILNGILPPGTKIASERELSEELDASRMTVRHAIEIIEGEGLVTSSLSERRRCPPVSHGKLCV